MRVVFSRRSERMKNACLVICGTSLKNFIVMIGRFIEVCKRGGLKMNAEMMLLRGKGRCV